MITVTVASGHIVEYILVRDGAIIDEFAIDTTEVPLPVIAAKLHWSAQLRHPTTHLYIKVGVR